MWGCSLRPQEPENPGAGVIGGCKLPNVDAWNGTQVPRESSTTIKDLNC